MPRRIPYQWIEEREARQVREFTLLLKTGSDPPVPLACAEPAWDWRSRLRAFFGRKAATDPKQSPGFAKRGWRPSPQDRR